MLKDKRVRYRISAQVGGRYPIGGEVWTKQDEDNFRWWYSRMSKYKGLNPDPDDIEQYYDYRGFWREDPKRAESMLRMDATQHFVDKWKYPGHPTFSNESIYSNDRTPGGSWVEHEGKFYYKPSFYTSGYLDRTREYLRGTDEGIAIEGENGTEYILIPKMPDGGYVASRDNTSVGAPGIDANARIGNKIYQPINIAETIAGFVPGVGDVLDARDFMQAAANRDRVGMALAAAAFIPLAGDALQEYFKLRRRRKFLEEDPLKEGNKKGWDGSKIKESDEDLLEDMPEYAHPESPMDEALIAHNSRITSGAYERVTGKSIAGFGNKMRNIKQKYPGIYEKMFDVDNIDIDSKEAEDFLEMFFEEKPGTYKGLSKEGKRELLRKAYIRIYQESPMFKIGVDGDNAIAYSKYSFNNFFGDNPDGLNAGLSHELDHAVWSNADAENMAQMVRESDEWFDAGKITGNDREYLQNPLELSARGSQIKDYFGLADDTQEITPSMLKYAAKHYGETWIDNNMKSFFEGITDWDKAAKWLSKYATVTVPAALIPQLVESGEEDLKDMEDFNRRHGGPANTSVSEDGHVRYLGYRPFFNPMRLYQRRKYIIDKLVADYGLPVVDAEREVDGIMNKSFLDDGYYDVRNKSYGIGGWKGEDLKEFISTYKDGGLADQIDFLAKKIKRMPSGGYIASRDNTSVGSQGIDANANYWNRIYQPINIAEMAAGFVPGVGDIMDARDFMQAAANKDRVGMALAAAAFIPLAGDAVQEYLKMRRLGMFDEIPVGRKKLRDDIKETDEELIEAMPDYADIESPYTEALSYHRARLKDMESDIGDDTFPFRQRYPGVYDEVFNLDEIDLDKISGDINSAYNQQAAKVAGALAGLNNDQIKELSLNDIKRIIRSGKMASSYSPYFSTVGNSVSGIFGSNRNLIDILGKDVSSPAASHELDHAIWVNMDKEVLEKAAKETRGWFDLSKTGNDAEVFKDKANELSARGSQIKDYFGLTEPSQKVTPEMLKYAARNYPNEVMDNNMVSFFNGIKDWDKAAEWITKYSTSVVPAAIVSDMASREEQNSRDTEQFGIGGRVGGVPVEYISLDGTDKKRGYSPLNGIGLISARARYIKNKLANDYGISKSKVDSLIDGLVRKNMLSSQHYDIKGKSFGIGNWKGEDLKEFVSTYKEGGLVDQIDFLAMKMKEGGKKEKEDNIAKWTAFDQAIKNTGMVVSPAAYRIARDIYDKIKGNPTELSRALYSAVDPTGEQPKLTLAGGVSALGNSLFTIAKLVAGNYNRVWYDRKNATLGDRVADAAWAKYNGLPYDESLIIDNHDGTFSIPKSISDGIRTSRDEIQKVYDINKKRYDEIRKGYDERIQQASDNGNLEDIVKIQKEIKNNDKLEVLDASLRTDRKSLAAMDSLMKKGYAVFDMWNTKHRDLREDYDTDLNVLNDFTIKGDSASGFKYRDKYDFGPVLDFMLKGEPFEIEGNLRNPYYDEGGLVERQDDLYETLTDEYEMPPIQAIAVIANLTHESGLDPYAEGDSGASLGLQQWRDDRRKALEKFALSRRHSYPTYDDQIAFLMNEYNNGQAFQFTHRGKNLYAAGKTKNPTFDYYQFSKNDFENANSLYDAVIAWNQGVGRPTKKYAYNDRRYAIAKSIADRHGIPYGNESFYNEMGFNDDAVIFDDDLVEKEEEDDQPTGSDAPAPSGEELFMEQYGNEVVAQMLAMENNARNLYNNTASMIRQHKQSLEEDKKREEESVKEVDERQREREFLAAVLPNLQLNIKGVSQIGRSNG